MKNILIVIIVLVSWLQVSAQVRASYVNNEGVNTWYQVYGEGEEAVLVINGGPGMNSRGFESLAKEFSYRYGKRIILYDQRGTGNSVISNPNDNNITLELMISDMEAIRKAEKLRSWILFGQSFGGMLAAAYTSDHPEKVDKLILSSSGGLSMSDLGEVDIMGRLSTFERDSFNYWNRASAANPGNLEIRLQRNKYLASAYLVGDKFIPVVARRLAEVNMPLNAMVFRDLRRIDFNVSEQMKSFDKPVLILIGEKDVVSLAAAKRAHNIFERSRLVKVPQSAHYGWLENPDVYFGALGELLK